MIKMYLKGCNVPEHLLTMTGHVLPTVKFGGMLLCWEKKGVTYLKPLTGNHAIMVSGGMVFNMKFNNVVILCKLSPLNLLRSIYHYLDVQSRRG